MRSVELERVDLNFGTSILRGFLITRQAACGLAGSEQALIERSISTILDINGASAFDHRGSVCFVTVGRALG